MKIAVPVKTDRDNPAVAPLFGKAKWFAFIQEGNVRIEPNPVRGGKAVVEWLAGKGVDALIFQEMGDTPYRMVRELGTIKLYHAGYDRIELDDALRRLEEGKLPQADQTLMDEIIARHETKHHGSHH